MPDGEVTVKTVDEAPALLHERLKDQFNLRSAQFEISANWVCDENLIRAHCDLAGRPRGRALDLCCGTGRVGSALRDRGWDVVGLDMTKNMLRASAEFFPAVRGRAETLPFRAGSFSLVVCRQSFQFLDVPHVLKEVRRLLEPGGVFVVSLTVPFSRFDRAWLRSIHQTKQPLLLSFYAAEDLFRQLACAGFRVGASKKLRVRESINRWMRHAPELSEDVRRRVIEMVRRAPAAYRWLHRVRVVTDEVFEDWNWVVIRAERGHPGQAEKI